MKNTWSIERGNKNTRFKVRFSPEVARYIKEEELFVEPRMKDLKDGTLMFEVTVNNEKEFLKWIQKTPSHGDAPAEAWLHASIDPENP